MELRLHSDWWFCGLKLTRMLGYIRKFCVWNFSSLLRAIWRGEALFSLSQLFRRQASIPEQNPVTFGGSGGIGSSFLFKTVANRVDN